MPSWIEKNHTMKKSITHDQTSALFIFTINFRILLNINFDALMFDTSRCLENLVHMWLHFFVHVNFTMCRFYTEKKVFSHKFSLNKSIYSFTLTRKNRNWIHSNMISYIFNINSIMCKYAIIEILLKRWFMAFLQSILKE